MPPHPSPSPHHAILYSLAGIGVLTGMDVLIKLVGVRYPTFELAFLRYVFGSLCAVCLWVYLRPPLLSWQATRINIGRGLIVSVSATCFFFTLQTLPLAEAVAFSFLSPLFLALFGALLLGERIGVYTFIGLVCGLAGMGVMVFGLGQESAVTFSLSGVYLLGAIAGLVSALTYALALVLLRQRAQQDALITIVTFQNIVPCCVLAIPAMMVWQPVGYGDLLLFLLIGAMGVGGQILLANAFKRAEAARLAPFEYTALIYASVFGFAFFGEIPGLATLLGAGLIILGSTIAMRRGRGDDSLETS